MTVADRTDPYDVVIVGAGISGSILAKELASGGADVLVLEAGTDEARTFSGYQDQLERFRGAFFKTPESPYAFNPNAPQPDLPDIPELKDKYFVKGGKQDYRSTYARTAGGTTLHWLGTCLRMLPEDFDLKTRFGRGRDWPLEYEDLMGDYERAEWEIGVAGDVTEQTYLGVSFPSRYQYPMQPTPPSWLDRRIAEKVDGLTVEYGGVQRSLRVRGSPAGRNSTPNGEYKPVGAVDRDPGWGDREDGQDLARNLGERCQGNTSCTPICPVQAKYNALKTLAKAVKTGNVRVETQAVAARVLATGSRVTGIEYLKYASPDSSEHTVELARGRTYVLACHAVENAKLLLMNPAVPNPSGLLGRCLYDHPTVLTWGLMPEPIGSFRGPLCTSGIEDLRSGEFRSRLAAFRLEIGNEGWLWPMGAPESTVASAIKDEELFGRDLRESVGQTIARQFRVGMLVEMLPDPANGISIAPSPTDQLGLPMPVVTLNNFDEYTLAGFEAASNVAEKIFEALGAEDHTCTEGTIVGTAAYRGREYPWDGAGHFAGTHLMGESEADSVVNSQQRFWCYDNLHVVGAGSMPTMGTSNPTLTVAALAFRTARDILNDLRLRDGRHA